MLEDRSYMRRESFKPQWSMMLLLLAVNVLTFILQQAAGKDNPFIKNYLELSNQGISQGYIWELLTFQFLHAGILHLLGNMVAIFFFGRLVEDRLGSWAFLRIYLLSGTFGGLFQILMGYIMPEQFRVAVIGASAGAFGLLAAATMLEPNSTIFLSFIIPVRAKYVLIAAAGLSLLFMFMPESQYAHAAHLGGILTGVACIRWGSLLESFAGSIRPHRRFRARDLINVPSFKGKSWSRNKGRRTAEMAPEEFISREVDPILDKISAHGIQSLTPQEREVLETARAKMEQRR